MQKTIKKEITAVFEGNYCCLYGQPECPWIGFVECRLYSGRELERDRYLKAFIRCAQCIAEFGA